MADGNGSSRDELDKRRALLRERRDADRAARANNSKALGEAVARVVETKLTAFEQALAAPLPGETKAPRVSARTEAWKGPHAGKKYRTAEALAVATKEECEEGFFATWGYRITDQDRAVFQITLQDTSAPTTTTRCEDRLGGINYEQRQHSGERFTITRAGQKHVEEKRLLDP